MSGSFFDTNVLIYIAGQDADKADRAESLIGGGGVVSMQVMNEITHVARRKMRLAWPELRAFLESIRGLLSVEAVTVETHETGLRLAERYGLSTWDAMIAASALIAGCERLWSEDMHDDLLIDGRLRIANPFGGRHA